MEGERCPYLLCLIPMVIPHKSTSSGKTQDRNAGKQGKTQDRGCWIAVSLKSSRGYWTIISKSRKVSSRLYLIPFLYQLYTNLPFQNSINGCLFLDVCPKCLRIAQIIQMGTINISRLTADSSFRIQRIAPVPRGKELLSRILKALANSPAGEADFLISIG